MKTSQPWHYWHLGWLSVLGSCPVHCRMFSSNPSFYSLNANSIPFSCDNQKCLKKLSDVPWMTNCSQLKTTDLIFTTILWYTELGQKFHLSDTQSQVFRLWIQYSFLYNTLTPPYMPPTHNPQEGKYVIVWPSLQIRTNETVTKHILTTCDAFLRSLSFSSLPSQLLVDSHWTDFTTCNWKITNATKWTKLLY